MLLVFGIVVVLALLAVLAVPFILERHHEGGEPRYLGTLRTLATAEADFKTNDRDGNGVEDFWVADVSGLYRIHSKGVPIKLIDPRQALADRRPSRPTDFTGEMTFAAGAKPVVFSALQETPEAFAGYHFVMLESYEEKPGVWVKYDGGSGRNPKRFGLCAVPALYTEKSRYTFIHSEETITWKKDTSGLIPEGFPHDPEKEGWAKLD